jgi:hypothetical protein
MMKSLFVFLLAALGFSQVASAYFVAVPADQGPVKYGQTTRLLVSGRGATLGMQPQLSALGRGLLYKRNFPNEQLVLISVLEDAKNEAMLLKNGWVFIVRNDQKFETDVAAKEILKFQKIRSLDFFGHNSPVLGTQTDGLGFRFDFRKPVVATIASHFEKGAYAMIHGCNSGWIIAQDLSKLWNIAVSGSFTGTRFERLHSDGHFYVFEDRKAPDNNWALINADLDGERCAAGACMRMRPSYSHYNGKWGDFEGPLLNHYKFFCQLDETECEKTMATSLYGYLAEKSLKRTSSYADFKEVAQQYLCPVYKDRKITEDCIYQLNEIEAGRGKMTVSYVVGDEQLKCDLKSCAAVMTCDDHICKVNSRVSKNSTTMAQEYLHLLNGFRALQGQGL